MSRSVGHFVIGEPKPGRRAFLKLVAGTAGAVAVGGLGWRAWDEGVLRAAAGAPYAPWARWREGDVEEVRDLVGAAILAASPHNTQPWAFRIGHGWIDVLADRSRNLGALDPFLEEMDLGLGCAIANLIEASRSRGFAPRFELAPDPADPNWVARVVLTARPGDGAAGGLAAAIAARHTNRGPYDLGRPLPGSVLVELNRIARRDPRIGLVWLTTPADRGSFADLTLDATRAIVEDREMSLDSAAWFRFDRDAIERHRDGITLDALGMPAWMRALAKLLPTPSVEEADARWIESTRDVHLATAPAFGILAVRDRDDLELRLKCGMAWQRMHLWATVRGIAMHPLNQLPERRNRERALGIEPRFGRALETLVSDGALGAVLCFRLGWPVREALPSPRRPVEWVVVP